MRLTQLRSFYAVGRYGSVTAAAAALHVSQPTVSTQVRSLEERYGVELFARRGRRIVLTSLGETLFAIAQRLFHGEQEAIDFLKEASGLRSGHLTLGAVGPFHAMEIAARFRQHYPGITISMVLGNSQATLRGLFNYETDVAVLAQYETDARLWSVRYRQHALVIVVPASHPFAKRRSIRLEQLADQPFIMRESGSTTRKAIEDALRSRGIVANVAMEVGSREAVREAVLLGLGITAVSEREHVDDAGLKKLTIIGADVFTVAHVVCLRERVDTRLIAAFFGVVNDLLAERPLSA